MGISASLVEFQPLEGCKSSRSFNYWTGTTKMKIKSELNPAMEVYSRYERPGENTELEHFISLLDAFELSELVKSVFYDSQSMTATYELIEMPPHIAWIIGQQVDRIAGITLTQYEDSAGCIGHGAPMAMDTEQ